MPAGGEEGMGLDLRVVTPRLARDVARRRRVEIGTPSLAELWVRVWIWALCNEQN